MRERFNKNDWINLGRWVQPPLSGCFWCHWHETKSIKGLGLGFEFEPVLFLDGYTLIKKADQKKCRKIVERVMEKKQIKKYMDIIQRTGKECERNHLAVLNKKYKDRGVFIADLFNTYKEVVGLWAFAIVLGEELQKYILKNNIVDSEEEIINRIKHKKTLLELQSIGIKKFAKEMKKTRPGIRASDISLNFIKKNKKIFDEINKYVDEFIWFGTHHWMGNPYNMKKCIQQIKEEIDRKQNIKRLKATELDKPIWRLFSGLAYWRTHCAEITCKVVYKSRPKLNRCALEWGIDYWRFVHLPSMEILKNLSLNLNTLKFPNFKAREKGYGCYLDDKGNEIIITGEKLEKIKDVIIEKVNTNIKEIKGITVSKGKGVIGKVKVLLAPKDFPSFKKGDILVAPETTPDFIPYMKMASAIVTQTGGVTSHAAIVSRELGIPCIIGAKIATRVLRDGDLVEVDANKGVIKIIKKK